MQPPTNRFYGEETLVRIPLAPVGHGLTVLKLSILLLLLFGIASLTVGAHLAQQARAEPQPGPRLSSSTTFFDGSANTTLTFRGPGTDRSIAIRLPHNATLHAASLDVSGYGSKDIELSKDVLVLPGNALASGDLNRDGYPDLVIGSPDQKAVSILWGSAQAFDRKDNTTITGAGIGFGENAAIGDLDNDGYDDLIIGYRTAHFGQGEATIYWGNPTRSFGPSNQYALAGEGQNSHFCASLETGDIDGDGYDDLVVGAPQYPQGGWQGRTYIFWGAPRGAFTNRNNRTLTGEARGDDFGWSLSIGDLNADGYDDIAIGAHSWPSSAYQGRVYLYWGNQSRSSQSDRLAFTGDGYNHDFGASLATGDIDGDGYDDLLVGAPGADRAYLYWGNATGSIASFNTTLSGEAGSGFGYSMAAVDLDADGYDDACIGAPHYPNGSNNGRAHILWGEARDKIDMNTTSTAGSMPGSLFSKSFSTVDADNDHQPELIVNAPGLGSPASMRKSGILDALTTYPCNLSLSIGDGPFIWNHPGELFTPHAVDLKAPLAQAIAGNCTCPGCTRDAQNCTILLNLASESKGILVLSDLNLLYT